MRRRVKRRSRLNNRFTVQEQVLRLVVLAMLSALGFVLMKFAQFPYPGAPWLKVELSETVVFVAYALYGFPGGISVALIKTILDFSVGGWADLGVGDITALLASLLYLLGLYLTNDVFKWFKKGLGFRILSYVFMTVLVSVVMTILNAFFITPSYLAVYSSNPHFATCFEEGSLAGVISFITHNDNLVASGWTYVGVISMVYIPFNLMKGAIDTFAYEVLFNRVIFYLLKSGRFHSHIFYSDKEMKEQDLHPIDEKAQPTDNREKIKDTALPVRDDQKKEA